MGGGGGGGWFTPCNGLYGRLRPKGIPFSGFKYVKRQGIHQSLVEVHQRATPGKSVILGCKKGQKGSQMYLMAVENSKKCSGFVVYSYFKDSVSTVV